MPSRLDPEIVRLAEEAARKPDFAAVLARGATLSRRRTAAALVATVVVVAGLVGVAQLASRPQAVPVVPVVPVPSPTASESPESPEPSVTPDVFDPTAQQIIDDPESQLVVLQSAPGDAGTRVALWRLCPGQPCEAFREAVTITKDGSDTSTVPDATWSNALVRISATGDAVLVDYQRRLRIEVVGSDGSVAEADMDQHVAPVAEGEVLAGVDIQPSGTLFWATDTRTLTAHAVPVPEDTQTLLQTDSGQLRALTRGGAYAWSDDGGTTWNEKAGAVRKNLLSGYVASLDDTHVVVGGGDGATLFPFSEIRRLEDDDTWSVVDPVTDPMAYIGPAAVLPDGRFLVSVVSWSDWRYDRPRNGTPPGLYVSDVDDWTSYERIDSRAPFDTVEFEQPYVTHISVGQDTTVITAIGPDQSTAWTSEDLGATWHEMRVR